MTQLTHEQAFDLAVRHHQAGRLQEAEEIYRRILAEQPKHCGALHYLGVVSHQKGQFDVAVDLIRQALVQSPDDAEILGNLGNALRSNGQLDEAIAALCQAIIIRPRFAEAHFNLGIALREKGRLDEAIAAFRQTTALKPTSAEAYYMLGTALRRNGQFDEAIAAYRQAISLQPNFSEVYIHLGSTLKENKGQLDEPIAAFLRAIATRPNFPEAYVHLGNTLKDLGCLDEAIAAYRRAGQLNPDYAEAFSNLFLALYYHPAYDAQLIAQELRAWNELHAEPLRKFIQPHSNDRNPDRPLRIGYVSPDFRNHPVGRNLVPLFQHHDRRLFQITAYAQVQRPDKLTELFQENSDAWRDILRLSDEEVARQIREDRIDILVDLALHTAGNRLHVFARKPAPVQVSYLGYCGSTELSTMDYRLSDPYFDPPSVDGTCYSEKTFRLPRSYWCYMPGVDLALAPGPSPALKNGYVTFGCQNNYCKISSPVWSAWMAILRALPTSKLIVNVGHDSRRDASRKLLASAGIDPDRLIFSESFGEDYFLRYHQIDIALDPFPFGGGTTTCDALWMGVPVVTLSGQTAVGRAGRSILSNLGLPELVAQTAEQYVQIAIDLAGDLKRMDGLRSGMRARMLASALMDGKGFTRDMESAYRQMWRTWCEGSVLR
ncbi:MAG: tetratricopeptide repeat protein [Tepidisphaeraceae bacterium]|jgi:predicted O-linked N-acetylglucosamine transferase (SPINDLY family)